MLSCYRMAGFVESAHCLLVRWEIMMTSSNGNIFRVTGHLCGEFTGHRWIPHTKASKAELSCFLWSEPGINSWVNNREAGDLRCHRAHHDAIVMGCDLNDRNFFSPQVRQIMINFPYYGTGNPFDFVLYFLSQWTAFIIWKWLFASSISCYDFVLCHRYWFLLTSRLQQYC